MKRWGERVELAPGDGLVEVDYLGFGGVMIRRAVFERLEKPWFPIRFRGVGPDGNDIWSGEDYGFCDKAREAGFALHVDAALSFRFGHLGQQQFRLSPRGGNGD
jgi:hypothetical protein